jgi:hypothetical protein
LSNQLFGGMNVHVVTLTTSQHRWCIYSIYLQQPPLRFFNIWDVEPNVIFSSHFMNFESINNKIRKEKRKRSLQVKGRRTENKRNWRIRNVATWSVHHSYSVVALLTQNGLLLRQDGRRTDALAPPHNGTWLAPFDRNVRSIITALFSS